MCVLAGEDYRGLATVVPFPCTAYTNTPLIAMLILPQIRMRVNEKEMKKLCQN